MPGKAHMRSNLSIAGLLVATLCLGCRPAANPRDSGDGQRASGARSSGVAPAPGDGPWISIAPNARNLLSLGELRVIARARNLNQDAATDAEWEIRSAANPERRVVRVQFPWPIAADEFIAGTRKIKGSGERGGGFTLTGDQVRNAGPVADGDYLLA